MVGNEFCNDETNTADCNYDGGDCCGYNMNSEYCSQCECYVQETCSSGYHPLVADGFCNDEINHLECNYDGGDCCKHPELIGNGFCNDETSYGICNFDGGDCCVNIDKSYCSECKCHGGGIITSPGFPELYGHGLDLTWVIQVPHGQTIEISFIRFDVEGYTSSCRYNNIISITLNHKQLTKLCLVNIGQINGKTIWPFMMVIPLEIPC